MSKSYSSTTSHPTLVNSEMSTSCTSNSRDLLLEDTYVGSATGDEDIDMINLKNNLQICKDKIIELRRVFLSDEGDEAKIVTSC